MSSIMFVNRSGWMSGAELVLKKLIVLAVSGGHRVTVVCPPGRLADQLPAEVVHVPIKELDLSGQSGIARVAALFTLMSRWLHAGRVIRRAWTPGTVVIVNSLNALPAIRAARIPGGASWLVHDIVADAQQQMVVRVSRAALRRVVVVSPPAAVPLNELGVESVLVPLGVEIVDQRADLDAGATPIVGMMGVITPWKGHRVLLEALARVPNVHCEIAGAPHVADEGYAAELRRRAAQPDLDGRVSFLGFVDPLPTLSRWTALISAGTSPEPGPTVALEAMGLGVPVIGTNHGGCAWALRDDVGVVVPPGDAAALAEAITRVVSDADLAAQMGKKGRERALTDHDARAVYPAMLAALLN
ncbi:glycosyltransferase family 4 protein [Mycolicibacterium sp. CBMA 226]|uniref:glycosyltransferase family 4 protein n=1 Tax=Mycolicibacterium sp. CBMA 226 TaxID=2606611 RepID=UPI0012DCAC99|nr:glycosyltransferase family 4 protein [Mycolicibacterium sp. CBMA 226]MUL78122.1 glycosyltransferase family 4 protein [Mycolicibacterium sp. CBMA 226]